MKKNYSCKGLLKSLSAAVLALTLSGNVSAKTWDFTNWSAATVSNLTTAAAAGVTGGEWSDTEKANGENPQIGNCYWSYANNVDANDNLTVNSTVIPETEGLIFNTAYTAKRSLAIAINYPSTSLGSYAGPKYLWLGGGNAKTASARIWCFKIPNVPIGAEISITAESHKPTEGRGVALFVGDVTNDANRIGDEFKPQTLDTNTWEAGWELPEGCPANEDGETVDIFVYNTNGCHIYEIKVDDGEGNAEEDTKIAVVSALGDLDPLYFAVQSGFEYTFIDANAEDVTLADLQEYEAVLVTPSVNADSKIAPVLREAVAYQPIVNASADLIQAWGLATMTPSESGMINVSEANLSHSFFGELPFEDGALELLPEGVLSTVTPGEYLANDDVLATVGEAPFILVHNAARNPHILIPFAAAVLGDEAPENVNGLVANALKVAGKGKKTVTQAAAPAITSALGKLKTTVSISGAGVIRYAVGAADVTVDENSPVYTEPFEITENGTYVKAYAVQDGYLKSDVTSYEVSVQDQADAPTFAMTQDETSTTVEINAAEGTKIYYTFWLNNGKLDPAGATEYTEPIVLSEEPTAIYAIATSDKALTSEIAEDYVSIKSLNSNTIRMDTVSHFSASQDAWYPATPHESGTGEAKAHYYWGKNAWNYYSDTVIGTEPVDDGEGNITEKNIYAPAEDAIRTMAANEGTETDWRLFSQGQVLTGELTGSSTPIVGNGATGYYYDEATDLIGGPANKGYITFGAKKDGEPYTAAIESVVTFKAPFDVVAYVGNGNSGSKGVLEIQTSTDGKTWTKAGDVKLSDTQRYVKKTRVSVNEGGEQYVRIAQVGGGTKAQVHDLYVLNHGDKSSEYTGIEEVLTDEAAEVISVEYYNLNGMRIAEPANGFYIQRSILSNGNVEVKKVVK